MDKKSLNLEIGSRIRLSRESAGITQEELAEKINRSTQFISTIERGVAGPSLETVIRLCEILNVSSEWLLRGKQASADAELIANKVTPLSREQLSALNRMTDDLLELINVTKEER